MRTVFVIGAGANVEIGMPSGNELKAKIAEILNFTRKNDGSFNGDKIVLGALNLQSREQYEAFNLTTNDDLLKAAINTSNAMALSGSIDNFIESRKNEPGIVFCGKLAITKAVIDAEMFCALPNDDDRLSVARDKAKKLNDSWYPQLFFKITEGCQIYLLAERLDNISFIIFNYDRCFEYFMYNSLMTFYNLNHESAKSFVQSLHINHPYGTVGNLWDSKDRLTFGIAPDVARLLSLVSKIKTFTENVKDEAEISNNRIIYLIERADRVVFLGFAYHDQNTDILFKQPGKLFVLDGVGLTDNVKCYGTGYGFSDNDLTLICDELKEKDKRISNVDILSVVCSEFFQKFVRELSLKS